jgi:DNA-binding MurR/RpiR family transcriptional regulator
MTTTSASPEAKAVDQASLDQAQSSPLVRIRSLLPGLAKAEQRVAEVVLSDPGAVAKLSITEVSDRAHTSETTVTRFCKAIGIGGYPELRISLAAEAARSALKFDTKYDADITEDDDLQQVVGKIGFADARAVEDSVAQLNLEELQRTISAISTAGRVDVYGVGASAFVAADIQQKLHRIGHVCFAWNDAHIMLTSAAVLGKNDVAIGISHTGATTEPIEALRQAKSRGATTIAITNFERSPITAVADIVLTTAARETAFRSGATASRIAQLTIVDCLFIGVARHELDKTQARLQDTFDAVSGHRLDSRPDGRRRDISE